MNAPAELSCRGVVATPGGQPVLRGVDLDVQAGTLTVLTGPSGVGKTTLLRTVAGLQPLEAGTIRLAGDDLTAVATHRRRIAYVFQRPRLFPNLTVLDNVAFPLRMEGIGRDERTTRARDLLDDVGLSDLGDRRTRGLSGGEAQRIALARALAGRPRLLLLDEPLASVDPSRREDLRGLIARLQEERGVTTVYVTHDRVEAAELADRIAFMTDGRIRQHGDPRELFERPVASSVATFFGSTNLLRGRVTGGELHVGGLAIPVTSADGTGVFTIRPERVELGGDGPLRMRVAEVTYTGADVRVRLESAAGMEIEARTDADGAVRLGDTVGVTLPPDHLWRLPDTAEDPPVGDPAARDVDPIGSR